MLCQPENIRLFCEYDVDMGTNASMASSKVVDENGM